MLLLDHFSVKTYFSKLFLVCFTYLNSSSQNFVTFSSKTDKVINKSYFCRCLNIHNLVSYFQNCSESIFKAYVSCYYCINTGLLIKEKAITSSLLQKRYSQNSMINIKKYCKNQTLNITCSKFTSRYIISVLVRVSGTVSISSV